MGQVNINNDDGGTPRRTPTWYSGTGVVAAAALVGFILVVLMLVGILPSPI